MTALAFVITALCVVLLAAVAMTPAAPETPEVDGSRGTYRG